MVSPPRRSLRSLIVAASAVAAFAQSLFGDFVSDDRTLLGGRARSWSAALWGRFWDVAGTNDGSGAYAHAYRPVVQLALAAQQRLFGQVTLGYHAVSLALHVVNALLVMRWLERRLRAGQPLAQSEIEQRVSEQGAGAPEAASRAWGVLVGALIFAIHPAHAESVAWISGSTDLWMTAAWLLAFELLEREGVAALVGGCACLFAAVLAKEPAVLAPLLWLIDRAALDPAGLRGVARREARRALAAFGAVVSAAVLVYVVAWGTPDPGSTSAQGAPSAAGAFALLGRYAQMTVWPAQLTFQAQWLAIEGGQLVLPPLSIAAGAALVAVLLVAAIVSVRRVSVRPWVSDAAWFVLPLLPVVVLAQGALSDRFLYVPLLGVAALAARGVASGLASSRAAVRVAVVGVAALALVAMVPAGQAASLAFRSEETLWRSQRAAFPALPRPLDALGEELARQGRFEEARAVFERGYAQAARVNQRGPALHFVAHLLTLNQPAYREWQRAELHAVATRCVALFERRRAEYARGTLRIALRVTRREAEPLSRDVQVLLVPCARALLGDQDVERAIAWADRAVALRPRDPAVLELAALARARAGEYEGARLALRTLSAVAPDADLSALARRIDSARTFSAQPRPTDAKAGALYDARRWLILGTPEGARRALEPALAAAPNNHEFAHALAQTYVSEGRFDVAAAMLEQGAVREPEDAFWAESLEALRQAQAQREPRDE